MPWVNWISLGQAGCFVGLDNPAGVSPRIRTETHPRAIDVGVDIGFLFPLSLLTDRVLELGTTFPEGHAGG